MGTKGTPAMTIQISSLLLLLVIAFGIAAICHAVKILWKSALWIFLVLFVLEYILPHIATMRVTF